MTVIGVVLLMWSVCKAYDIITAPNDRRLKEEGEKRRKEMGWES